VDGVVGSAVVVVEAEGSVVVNVVVSGGASSNVVVPGSVVVPIPVAWWSGV
jgi:hypothetical protein